MKLIFRASITSKYYDINKYKNNRKLHAQLTQKLKELENNVSLFHYQCKQQWLVSFLFPFHLKQFQLYHPKVENNIRKYITINNLLQYKR